MITVTHFEPVLADQIPETHALLKDGGLCLHDAVDSVTLHGSRGLQGGARPNSDLDLCLIVNGRDLAAVASQDTLLRSILETTLKLWTSAVEVDLAAVFDKLNCGLRCFSESQFNPGLCQTTVDCMGLFKIQKGFDGFVTGPEVDCSKMYPLIRIWHREMHNNRVEDIVANAQNRRP